jgi:predicted transcriptional regulator
MNANEWANIIVSSKINCAEKVPAGWKTRLQLEEEWGVCQSHAGRRIQDLMKLGKIERKTFKVITGNRLYPTPHYKIKK